MNAPTSGLIMDNHGLNIPLIETNKVLSQLPGHLLSLVIEQPYESYTAQDHAVWRYVMKQNIRHLPGIAHPSYMNGLKRTGISIERIPHMYGMNRILSEIGWAAVAVDGFIPPAAFMEFQAHKVLVIAADIRPVDQILYTPAPDIIHEAAGHAPIIADEEYSTYLQDFGKLGSRAFSSVYDSKIYEAIRHLSILKADPYTPPYLIEQAENDLENLSRISNGLSEMALLRNLHWWTVEYGLIGDLTNPKIYGAGLLSSIGESYNCLQDSVRKIPYSIDAQHVNFDITREQPQLFVTPDFSYLNKVLEEYAESLAMIKGGISGLHKAVISGNTATVEYSSGLQISGTLTRFLENDLQPAYLFFTGPSMLCYSGIVISGQGKKHHPDGFGSPVGKLINIPAPLESLSQEDLSDYGITEGKVVDMTFESGINVRGTLISITRREGRNILFSLEECLVKDGNEVLFQPSWGSYDMAIGALIPAVFSGPADPEAFGFTFPVPVEKTHKLIHAPDKIRLHSLYQSVREVREKQLEPDILVNLFENLVRDFPDEWLLPLEIHEILRSEPVLKKVFNNVKKYLEEKALKNDSERKLILDGMEQE